MIVTALLAVFTFDKVMVIVLMTVFGVTLSVALTPLSALGVVAVVASFVLKPRPAASPAKSG